MGRPGSVQLARVFGIRIGADYSWFATVLVAIYFFRELVSDRTAASDALALVGALALTFLAFGSVVVHELGHALAARRHGLGVSGIRLFVLGGYAYLTERAPTPGVEFRWIAAGPLGTLLVVLASAGAGLLSGPGELVSGLTFDHEGSLPVGTTVASTLALMNLAALVVNLLPVYPLDGGRMALAAAWRLTGDRWGTMWVGSLIGIGFGAVLILGGLLAAARDYVFLGLNLVAIGAWIAVVARRGAVQAAAMKRLESVTVGDVMPRECYPIPADYPALRAYEEFFRNNPGLVLYPVVEPDDSYVGCAWGEPVRRAAEGADRERPVRELVSLEDDRVPLDASFEALVSSEPMRRRGYAIAVDEHGRLRGFVNADHVRQELRERGLLAPGPGERARRRLPFTGWAARAPSSWPASSASASEPTTAGSSSSSWRSTSRGSSSRG